MASTRRRRLRSVTCLVAAAGLSLSVVGATAADRVAFTISDPRITESSGLARDTHAGVYWTANDSGSEVTAYGLDAKGAVRGIIGLRVKPVDLEAVAMHDNRLYLADIGDNQSRRTFVSVYFVDDPQPDNRTRSYRSYDFGYPDGAHDAETLLVDGDGRLYIVTKGLKAGIYAAPRRPSRQGVNRLTRVAKAPVFVTDGMFLPGSPGHQQIVLRTYVSVEVLDGTSYRTVARAATPAQPQGESVSMTLNGKALLVGSEGKNSQVLQMAVPSSVGSAPAPGSKPPGTAKPSASAPSAAAHQDEPPDDPAAGATASRAGTVLAIALAGLVALIAGVIAGAGRRSKR